MKLAEKALDAIQDLIDGDGTWEEKYTAISGLAYTRGQTSLLEEFVSWFDEDADAEDDDDEDDDEDWE